MAPLKSVFSAPAKAVDPALDALFTSSTGPVESRARPKYEGLVAPKQRPAPTPKPIKPLSKEEEEAAESSDEDDNDDDDEEDEDEDDNKEEGEESTEGAKEDAAAALAGRKNGTSKRKRKNRDDDDNLEGRYFDKLAQEVDGPAEKPAKRSKASSEAGEADDGDDSSDGEPIIHESLRKNGQDNDASAGGDDADAAGDDLGQDKEKAGRTVFLSNISIKAVTDKAAKKTLIAHLASVAEETPKKEAKPDTAAEGEDGKDGKDGKDGEDKERDKSVVESLRFRSVPFASAALPKRAAYITKAVMGATAQSTNAYAVYSTVAAARLAVQKLNGTVVLDRHLRADSVAHPSPVDHRRCVFVGNLGFVDDETVLNNKPDGEDGEAASRKRHKTPMDVEEGLWRTFGKHAGKVESVRVIRDQVTRVGKGFAYVQFYDANSVESALLLADRRFPPLLPRALRVSRCKAPHKTARAIERTQVKGGGDGGGAQQRPERGARDRRGMRDGQRDPTKGPRGTTGYTPKLTAEQQTSAGRAAKLLGQSAGGNAVVFEGMRARAGSSKLFKKGKNGKNGGKGGKGAPGKDGPPSRRMRRSAEWRGKKGGNA